MLEVVEFEEVPCIKSSNFVQNRVGIIKFKIYINNGLHEK